MSNFDGLYNIRSFRQEDTAFIFASSLRGIYHGDSWFSLIPRHIFMVNYKNVISALMSNPNTIIKVAVLPEDDNVIIGYSILSKDLTTAHWIFVKSAWRLKGVARNLVPKNISCVTHLTAVGKDLLLKKFPTAIFNPFQIGA